MRNSPTALQITPKKKTRHLSKEEFEALINMLPEAVLIVDNRDGSVLLGNAEATTLTSCASSELIGINIANLLTPVENSIPAIETIRSSEPNSIAIFNLSVQGQRHSQVLVEAEIISLGMGSHWTIVKFETLEQCQKRRSDAQFLAQSWPALEELASLPQLENLDTILLKMLQTGQKLFGAESVALYQARGEKLVLEQIATCGKSEAFPTEISPADFMALKGPQLWLARERATASLQRAARVNGLHYLVSAPLGKVNASIGMVVVGGSDSPPSSALSIIQILASYLTTALQNAALTRSIQDQLDEQTYSLYIANTLINQIKDSLLVLSMDLKVLDLNRAAELSLGYSRAEIINHHVNEVLISDQSILPGLECLV